MRSIATRLEPRCLHLACLHLTVLSAFAIAQPLFDVLGRNATFFVARDSRPSEIVAFAVGVVLVPPCTLLVVEILLGLFNVRVKAMIHLSFVAALFGLIALQALKKTGGTGWSLVVAGGAIGVAGSVAYYRSRAVRSLVTVLAPAPIAFIAMFLFFSPVAKLVFPGEETTHGAMVSGETPVVVIVFDEFSSISLLNADRRIDPVRYPNFAALAREATWFRNATTVDPYTARAVPAIVTGRYPPEKSLPIWRDHPRSLFTFLSGSYDVIVHESATHLCPRRLCRRTNASAIAPGMATLVSDATVTYLHVVVPEPFSRRLPSITGRWGGFRDGDTRGGTAADVFRRFVSTLRPSSKPELYFLHSELPHYPWRYLPSGKRYSGPVTEFPGFAQPRWGADDRLIVEGQKRYFLQVGFVDRLVGELVAQLRSVGMYEDSLVIVTADHGLSFAPNEPTRAMTEGNVEQIAFVPLFVKAPRQRVSRVVDEAVETIDILPTIAEIIGVVLPWSTHGEAVVGTSSVRPRATLRIGSERFQARDLQRRRDRFLQRQLAMFGSGSGWTHLMAAGRHRDLVGKKIDPKNRLEGSGRVELDDASMLADVDVEAPVSPSFLTGRVAGLTTNGRRNLVVALNGRIVAVTPIYLDNRFAALIPENAFRNGRNRLSIFLLRRTRTETRLESLEVPAEGVSYALDERDGSEVIESSTRGAIPVVPGAVAGAFDLVEVESHANDLHVRGWAAGARGPVWDELVVFAGERFVGAPSARRPRPDLGTPVRQAGFDFRLPIERLRSEGSSVEIRVFAVVGDRASELGCRPDPRGSGPLERRAIRTHSGPTLELPTPCRPAGRAVPGVADALITPTEINRYASGTPANALLSWWWYSQHANLGGFVGSFERSLRTDLVRTSTTRAALDAFASAIRTMKPARLRTERHGRRATVFTSIEQRQAVTSKRFVATTTPRAFEMILQDGRWLLADDFFVQTMIPASLRR